MITEETVQAYADTYELDELQRMRREALEKLTALDAITSANTGGGVSYTRTERLRAQELVDLLQAAINRKQNTPQAAGSAHRVRFRNTYC